MARCLGAALALSVAVLSTACGGSSSSNSACGAASQACCASGAACNGGLSCQSGTCQTPSLTVLAGEPSGAGSLDGTGSAARFSYPYGVAVDGAGNVYVADQLNSTIRKITMPAGVVSTLAGSPAQTGSTDGTGSAARFYNPQGVAVDGSGNVYVADRDNSTIRKITPAGLVSTLAGSAGQNGGTDGTGSAAHFFHPFGVAVDGSGNIYVADTYNSSIRKITPAGAVTTLAGSASQLGSADGTGSAARFHYPYGVAVDGSGNVYVADSGNSTIRKITPAGAVTTLAGSAGQTGSTDATGSAARFYYPSSVTVDGSGNVYVADMSNSTIRKISPAGAVSTLAGSASQFGSADGTGSAARFSNPCGMAVDGSGNVYVADMLNSTIRKITTPAGVVRTLAGSAGQTGSTDGAGSAARFYNPLGVAVDGSGNIYVADRYNSTIRKITPAGVVSTVVGTAGESGTIAGPLPSSLFQPAGVAFVPTTGSLLITVPDAVLEAFF
jgi:sugar lactone lactonase YvrE